MTVMTAWDFLIDDAAIAAVVPEAYRRYRPAVRGALAIFLSGLSATRQAGLLTDQAALPPWTSPEERLATLARGCPTLHKLGQILARDRRLSPDLRGHLQGLESLPPTVSTEEVDAILGGNESG
jgi:ubiquinone biosynthesis protein